MSHRGIFNIIYIYILCLLRVALISSVLSPCPSLCVGGVGFHVLLLEPNEVAWAAPGGAVPYTHMIRGSHHQGQSRHDFASMRIPMDNPSLFHHHHSNLVWFTAGHHRFTPLGLAFCFFPFLILPPARTSLARRALF